LKSSFYRTGTTATIPNIANREMDTSSCHPTPLSRVDPSNPTPDKIEPL
jgi:hypothetical protein